MCSHHSEASPAIALSHAEKREEEGLCGGNDGALFRCFTYVSAAPRNVKSNPPELHNKAAEPFFSPSAALTTYLGVWFLFPLPVICYHSRGMVLIWSNSSLSHN